MIVSKVRYKNFFSSGNQFTEIDLLRYKKALIVGVNGEGKSSIFNAVFFGIFGKTIKKVTKALIVNSINNKNCLVEVELECNNKHYLIRRGIKPNIFELYEDSVLVDQTAVGDYQDYLELNIIKCSPRTFLQTSILSIEDYKPFMSLPSAQRREFIEDILDIRVFSSMNSLVKNSISKAKEELRLLSVVKNSLSEKEELVSSHIEKLESLSEASAQSFISQLSESKEELKEQEEIISASNLEMASLKSEGIRLRDQKIQRDLISMKIKEIEYDMEKEKKKLNSFELSVSDSGCPSCLQNVPHEHISFIRDGISALIEELRKELSPIKSENDLYSTLPDKITVLQESVSRVNAGVSLANKTISLLNSKIVSLEKSIISAKESKDVNEQKNSLYLIQENIKNILEKVTSLNVDQEYNSLMVELFKDSGIKSKIVDQYIPVINKLVNTYLEKFEFFVSFNLDSEFNETIKSRHRDAFTYSSFSAGEKQRIDLALLFTFRGLARMKNSFDCNLLLMDELLDASLDSASVENLLSIFELEEFKKSNLFVISHSKVDMLSESFQGQYLVKKRDSFSEVEEVVL